jgi:hypothetical protein
MTNDTRFWNATERAEADFTGSADVSRFRRKMRKLGHDWDAIADRIASIHPRLSKQEKPDDQG